MRSENFPRSPEGESGWFQTILNRGPLQPDKVTLNTMVWFLTTQGFQEDIILGIQAAGIKIRMFRNPIQTVPKYHLRGTGYVDQNLVFPAFEGDPDGFIRDPRLRH